MEPNRKTKSFENTEGIDPELLAATELMMADDLEDETGLVSGEVSEIAHDNASENGSGSKPQKDDDTSNATKEKKALADLDDRTALRERLLAHAPMESAMRKEVKETLLAKKEALQKDIHKHRHNYALLSEAMAQLRAVVRELKALAHASYDALKEIWLRVVHKFA